MNEHNKYTFEKVRDTIKLALSAVIQENDPKKESLLLSIYDSLTIKPGILGVSVDVKYLIEHFVPDIRERMAGKTDPLSVLKPFVTTNSAKIMLDVKEADRLLGTPTLRALIDSGFILRQYHRDTEFVMLAHDMIAAAIHDR